MVNTTMQYTKEVLDANHDGFVSLSEVAATENTPYWTYEPLLPSMILVVRNDTTGDYRFVEGLETREINSSSRRRRRRSNRNRYHPQGLP